METSEFYEFAVGRFSDSCLHIVRKVTTPDTGKEKETKFSQSWHKEIASLSHFLPLHNLAYWKKVQCNS